MPSPINGVTKADGSYDWSGGVDSVRATTIQSQANPTGLARNQLAWLDNATVRDAGITPRGGYIELGQSAVTLSGGEAQRIKLARELSKRQTGKTLYLLDEPTTGLHFDDVKKLLDVLHRLTDLGNSIIIIEHNLDVIRNADWIIDLGPEGGEDGGRIVTQGTPDQVSKIKKSYTGQALAERLVTGGK